MSTLKSSLGLPICGIHKDVLLCELCLLRELFLLHKLCLLHTLCFLSELCLLRELLLGSLMHFKVTVVILCR